MRNHQYKMEVVWKRVSDKHPIPLQVRCLAVCTWVLLLMVHLTGHETIGDEVMWLHLHVTHWAMVEEDIQRKRYDMVKNLMRAGWE